jgi:hypothetical protein
VLNLKYMNTMFHCKWYWHYKYINTWVLWQLIVSFKYATSFFSSNSSAFWKALFSISHFLLLGSKRVVGNVHSINFWLDIWYNDYSLSIQFTLVYAKIKSSFVSLHNIWNMGHIKLNLTCGANITLHQEKVNF